MVVPELDALDDDAASQLLTSCCGSRAWVRGMLARRPFGSMDHLLDAADDAWAGVFEVDWREAFDHHPRIGSRTSAVPQDERAQSWSSREQSGMDGADDVARADLRHANEQYEARFGYICIICAAGRSASELLSITRARLTNEPDVELRIAAEEQRRITRLRLSSLFHDPAGVTR